MRKRALSIIIVLAVALSMPVQALASDLNPNREGHADFNESALREVILNQSMIVNQLTTSLTSLVSDEFIADLVKGAVSNLLETGNIADIAGDLLSSLIADAIKDNFGIDIPGSINVSGIISNIVAGEIVTGILTSDLFTSVIDKTIDNIIAAIDLGEMAGLLIDMLFDDIIDQLVAQIWNSGNPSSSVAFGIQTGHWNTTGGWNSSRITLALGASAIGGFAGMAANPNSINIDYMALLPPAEVLLGAVFDAVCDTAAEHLEDYKLRLLAAIQAEIANEPASSAGGGTADKVQGREEEAGSVLERVVTRLVRTLERRRAAGLIEL
jgi:hypothetical protein